MTSDARLKEKYQVMPAMPPAQFEALKVDIMERGVLVPIDVDEHGYILDGHHRYRACVELGITDFATIVRPGLTEEGRRIFARKNNMLRRHLNRKQVREIIAEQLKDTPTWANNRIAQVLGTDSKTVKVIRERLERTSEIPKLDKLIGADGKTRPVKQKRPAAIMASNTDDLLKIFKKFEQGASIEEIQGFLSEQGFTALYTIEDDQYNPFSHCDEDGKRGWLLFILFLKETCGFEPEGAWGHVEWVLQREFKTVAEWFGEEGRKFRMTCGMPEQKQKLIENWEAFFAEHDGKSLSDIEALMAKAAGP